MAGRFKAGGFRAVPALFFQAVAPTSAFDYSLAIHYRIPS